MSAKINVAILEDHQSIIDGYRFRLQDSPEFEIVGIANLYSDWEAVLKSQVVQIALMDVKVPVDQNNSNPYPILHVMPRLVQAFPDIDFLVISAYPEPTLIQGIMEAGASGYILKDDNVLLRELKTILHSVIENHGIYFSPKANEQLLQRLRPIQESGLALRQLEALSLCAAYPGSSTKEIAAQMNVAGSTVRNLLSQTYIKLGVSTRQEAVLKAQQLGLITRPE